VSTDPKTTIAILRTGLIDAPVARNLRKRGVTVHAWNRTAAQAGVQMDAAQAGLWRFERELEAERGAKDMAAPYLA